MAIGFPLFVIFSWAYEITPEGLKREKDVERDASITHLTAKRLDMFTIGLIVVALAFILADRFWISPRPAGQSVVPTLVAAKEGQIPEPQLLEPQYPPKSIAVLPFVDMSDDAANEYFADGIAEELLNLLTRIPDLRVIARSSAFAFKGEKIDIPEVAKKLKVANILEGSVRKAGNQVRITAQLVKGSDGYHLWSKTYDRELENIFAIQDEIAAAVVKQLEVTLLGAASTIDKTDPEAFALLLQARHLRSLNRAETLQQAQTLVQQALVLDPGYAAGWTLLSGVYMSQANIGLRPIDQGFRPAREAASKALSIDPEFAMAHATLGSIAQIHDNDLVAAAKHVGRALQLEPANTDVNRIAALLAQALGRPEEALALMEFAVARDPFNPVNHQILGGCHLSAGRWDESIASKRIALMLGPGLADVHYAIGVALLLKGEPQAALEAIQAEESLFSKIGLALVYHALGRADESDAALAELIEQYAQVASHNIAYVLAYRGEVDRAVAWLDKAVMYKDTALAQVIIEPLFSNLHSDPRWLPFLASIGKSPEQLAAIEFEVTLPE